MKEQVKEVSPLVLFIFLVNLVIGTGVFLNASRLFTILGGYSFLAYVITGILMFPILLITYNLSVAHPGKNMLELFYFYFKEHSNFFVSLYSVAKLATAGVAIIFSANLLHTFCASFGCYISVELFFFLIFVLCFFLSYFDYSISSYVQYVIIFLKMVPIFLTIILLCYFFGKNFSAGLEQFRFALPFANSVSVFSRLSEGVAITIFSFAGFEALFSLGHYRLRAEKRGFSFAMLLIVGFVVAWLLYSFYQFGMAYLVLKSDNNNLTGAFDFLTYCFSKSKMFGYFIRGMGLCVLASSFGVAHGIAYTALQNLSYSFSVFKLRRSSIQIFIFSLLLCYGIVFFKTIFLLQQLSSLGTILTYVLFVYCYGQEKRNYLLMLGIFSCMFLLGIHIYTAYFYLGFFGYLLYCCFALVLFFLLRRNCHCF